MTQWPLSFVGAKADTVVVPGDYYAQVGKRLGEDCIFPAHCTYNGEGLLQFCAGCRLSPSVTIFRHSSCRTNMTF